MDHNAATARRRPSGRAPGTCAVLLMAALAALALGFVPGLAAAPASAAVAPAHSQHHAPSNPTPAKATHKAPAVGTTRVKISNFKFGPRTLTVKVGAKVTWTNHDAIAHSVNFATGNVNSKTLEQNATYSRTFSTPGTYQYICAIHPFMHGTVVVTA